MAVDCTDHRVGMSGCVPKHCEELQHFYSLLSSILTAAKQAMLRVSRCNTMLFSLTYALPVVTGDRRGSKKRHILMPPADGCQLEFSLVVECSPRGNAG